MTFRDCFSLHTTVNTWFSTITLHMTDIDELPGPVFTQVELQVYTTGTTLPGFEHYFCTLSSSNIATADWLGHGKLTSMDFGAEKFLWAGMSSRARGRNFKINIFQVMTRGDVGRLSKIKENNVPIAWRLYKLLLHNPKLGAGNPSTLDQICHGLRSTNSGIK